MKTYLKIHHYLTMIERLEEDIKTLGTLHNQDQQFEEIMLTAQLMTYKRALRMGCLKKATDDMTNHRSVGKSLSL